MSTRVELGYERRSSTALANMVLLCHRHHWSAHEGGWQLVATDGRRALAIPPSHTYRSWTRAPDTTAIR